MAQLVEQRIRNAWVTSSSLVIGSWLANLGNICDSSSVGRAQASQAWGRGFDPRLSLLDKQTRQTSADSTLGAACRRFFMPSQSHCNYIVIAPRLQYNRTAITM